ncbi:heavy metal translocating P-type ATPase [Corynebacterium falsenii]|uniref:heavy metal translocating P-type ATPase n=1 Tax=Corynebacterium falsenii TaxID=108486 RepID=UPI001DFF7CC4|nr:HAD-IC family P-type ATPase [Corynebacterium falsenii]HJF11438.1 HAD-IC family P-type ATPase [Corynebacterium falsenii]
MADRDISVEDVDAAILEARTAATQAGFDLDAADGSTDYHQRLVHRQGRRLTSFSYRLEGLESAVDATTVQEELNALPGVEASVVYSTKMAWISAEDHVNPDDIQAALAKHGLDSWLTDSSLRRRSSRLELADTRRRMRRHADAHRRVWAAAERRKRPYGSRLLRNRTNPFDSNEGLHTARDLITRARLIVAVLFGAPVVAIQLVQGWQFDYWQWVCLALATPVVTWCAWPFHRAMIGGIRRGMSALDGASSLAILVAYAFSVLILTLTPAGDVGWKSSQILMAGSWTNPYTQDSIFFDVACGVTILLLFGRLMSRRTVLRSKSMLTALSVQSTKQVTVVRKNRKSEVVKKQIATGEIRTGDDIVVENGMIVPSDGEIISGKSEVDMGPVGGLHRTEVLTVGNAIYAGARNLGKPLKIRVHATGSSTRLAAMHRWVMGAARDENRVAQLTNRTASLLVPWALGIAAADFFAWYAYTGSLDAAMATALSVLVVVAPVALAVSAPLALRLGLWRAATDGVLLRDTTTIHKLASIDSIIFNRVGTLTTGPMRVIGVTAANDENPDLVLRVAGALSLESKHAVSRAIVRADREARDANAGGDSVPHWIETGEVTVTKEGTFEGTVDLPINGGMRHVTARLWRPRDLGELRDSRLAAAALSGGSPIVVSWKGKDRGVINLADSFKDDAPAAIDKLEDMELETFMISRDTYPVARHTANSLGISTVLAGIAPNRKEATVRGLHAQGTRVAMVGDRDIMGALRVADVGILMGSADHIDSSAAAAADVVLLRGDVLAIPETINLVRHVRNTADWNIWLSWAYNVVCIILAVVGLLNPLLATLLMLMSSALIERRSARILKRNYARAIMRNTHSWQGWTERLREMREIRQRQRLHAQAVRAAQEDSLEHVGGTPPAFSNAVASESERTVTGAGDESTGSARKFGTSSSSAVKAPANHCVEKD